MQMARNVVARLFGDTVSRDEHLAAQERIHALIKLSAEQQVEIMDKAQQIQANRSVIEAYQADLKRISAEAVRLRTALARARSERAEWRDRALEYRKKMGGQKQGMRR